MSILQSSTLLQSLTLQHGKHRTLAASSESSPSLRAKSSIASLLHLARHPIEAVSEVIEDWYDGTTKEQRYRRQSVQDRKQLLYLKLREVSRALLGHYESFVTDATSEVIQSP